MNDNCLKEFEKLIPNYEIEISKEEMDELSEIHKECRKEVGLHDDFFNWENEILNG